MLFRVIMRARNAEHLIGKTLKSLVGQTCEKWVAHVALDAPEDRTLTAVDSFRRNANLPLGKISISVSEKNYGVARQIYKAPWIQKQHCDTSYESIPFDPEDILVFLDGDGDKLDPKALRIVERAYQKNPKCLLTYGSYLKKSVGRRTKISNAYPDGANVRKHPWRGSHLKTMKWKLFRQIPEDCFKHKGAWLPACSDLALMMPAIELAGLSRCVHIHRLIYYYRDVKTKKKRVVEKRCEKIVRAKKPMRKAVW